MLFCDFQKKFMELETLLVLSLLKELSRFVLHLMKIVCKYLLLICMHMLLRYSKLKREKSVKSRVFIMLE